LTTIEKTIIIAATKQTCRARKNAIITIEFDLQKCFAAKQQEHLIVQFVIEKYTTKKFCLRADMQQ